MMKTWRWAGITILAGAALSAAVAQNQPSAMGPPKVLTIMREFVKPGKGGAMHDRTESAFVQAFTRAKWQTYYLGMNSLSGKLRSIFFVGYDSFDAWQKEQMDEQKNATLAAALDRAFVADGDLLDSIDGSVFTYNEEYSLHPQPATAATRYFDISVYRVKPGHYKDWDEAMKMVIEAYQKAVPDAHWACYEVAYGAPDSTYLFITGRKSASEIDQGMAHNKDFVDAMGQDGMKRLHEIEREAVESSESNLFILNPKMSYVSNDWIKADPDFWKPKESAAPAAAPKKPTEKPGAGQ
jgi:hypothetical protein